jgi:hypothetical protein
MNSYGYDSIVGSFFEEDYILESDEIDQDILERINEDDD